ncbi:MAG: tRNA (adenine(22)-N(1))-methyltransferase TrmK [Firmicutes bacterium]|nr:tRNA (adenine(22)-N(1))-methyltransferase TrmK [Candidatus Caballimonas caccae]
MTDRINKIVELIPKCETLADIGCDHGYISLGALKSGKVKKVIFSDISPLCLKKAQSNLCEYTNSGFALGIVSNGFTNLPFTETAVIAGMGGEETIKIISSCKNLPDNLVLQPMKNVDKVREYIVGLGYKITFDRVYCFDKKYYDFIVAVKGKDVLSKDEILFGRTNLVSLNIDFLNRLREQKKLLEKVLNSDISKNEADLKKELLESIKKYV